MSDPFDEAAGDILANCPTQDDDKFVSDYLRKNFIPRARVEALHKQFEDAWKVHHSHATMPADSIRELFEYLLEK